MTKSEKKRIIRKMYTNIARRRNLDYSNKDEAIAKWGRLNNQFNLYVRILNPKTRLKSYGTNPRMIADWCSCKPEANPEHWIFKDDGVCECGVGKHHYHCPKCHKITQTG